MVAAAAVSARSFAADELEVALERTQGEAERSFGDPVVFLERLVTDARHVEVQVVADNHGNVWAPGVRDCSIQRRNQKVIEESSSPVLTKEQADHLRDACRPTSSAPPDTAAPARWSSSTSRTRRSFTFLEVNTRLQVEHPITEVTTGLDLVKLQIFVASGGALEGECPAGVRPRRRGPAQRRGCRQRLRARAGHRAAAEVPARLRYPGRHRHRAGRRHPARLRLDGRQDHRVGPRPKRGTGPAAYRAA